jgi:hypothetical protein
LNRLGLFQSPAGSVRLRYKPSSSSSPSGLVSSDLSTTKYPSMGRGANNHHQHHHRRKPSILGEINPIQVKLKQGGEEAYGDDSSSSTSSNIQASSFFTSVSPTSSTADIGADGATGTRNALHCQVTPPPRATDAVKARVQFNENADVVRIPSRYQYSDRIRKVLWSNKHEIMENAERNIIEFESEGWDWQNVVLDDEMFIDSATGSLVHPCHLLLDGDAEDDGDDLAPESQEQQQQCPERQQQLSYDRRSAQNGEGQEQGSDGSEGDEDDDDSFFRPLQRQASVAATSSC